MIYIIDHQDSFTWNVVHQFSKFDKVICSNYYDLNKNLLDKSDVIVFSPGPGSPKDYPLSSKIYNKYKGKKKIIGICLGYQMILHNEGGKIIQQKKIYHGFQSKIKTNKESKVFKNNQHFKVGRYPIFDVKPKGVEIVVSSMTNKDNAAKARKYILREINKII